MKSLWKLAEERQQPDIQVMDQETLNFIKEFKPNFTGEPGEFIFSESDIKLISENVPHPSWYLNPEIAKSIHGIAHSARMMAYCIILFDGNPDALRSLLFACAVHDTQRINDKGDEGHEERALDWLKHNFSEHPLFTETCGILEGRHSLSNFLRTVDALDRYRLPKVKWWIDDSYLSIKPSDSIKWFAFNLVINSEQARLDGEESVEAVVSSLLVK